MIPNSDLLAGFPDSSNTGYRNAPGYPGRLTKWSGGAIQSNTTYSFIDFGSLSVGTAAAPVSNVKFIGCRFKDVAVEEALVVLFGDNITFDYSSFEPGVAAPPVPFNQSYQYGIQADGSYYSWVKQLTVSHSDFWGFANAIDVNGSTKDKPQVFRDNWIHDASDDGGDVYHIDGIGSLSDSGNGSYIVVDHNTIVSRGNTNGIAFQKGVYDHVTITRNLLGGFGYTVALWAPGTNTTFTDNVYTTQFRPDWGPLYGQAFWEGAGSVWARNRWAVPPGAEWGDPAHHGWYWIPNANGNSGTTDTPYVSQTDHN